MSKHYKMEIEPIEYINRNGLSFMEGNVVKYVSRHARKGGADDIKKAIHYLELILENEYNESNLLQESVRQGQPAPCRYPYCPWEDPRGPIENHD